MNNTTLASAFRFSFCLPVRSTDVLQWLEYLQKGPEVCDYCLPIFTLTLGACFKWEKKLLFSVQTDFKDRTSKLCEARWVNHRFRREIDSSGICNLRLPWQPFCICIVLFRIPVSSPVELISTGQIASIIKTTLELLKDSLERLWAIRIVGLIKVDCSQDYW